MSSPLANLHKFLVLQLVPSNSASSCADENSIVNVLEVRTNTLAFRVMVVLSDQIRANLSEIISIISKKLRSKGRHKKELCISRPSDIVGYQRGDTKTG